MNGTLSRQIDDGSDVTVLVATAARTLRLLQDNSNDAGRALKISV